MQENSRVKNASRNVAFGMFLKLYQVLLPFLMRTAIMYSMGMGYLGLNSFFGSVLWFLNITELGVGSAMVYSMYQPIIDGDEEEMCALLKLYRKYYRIIGTVMAVIGLIITPIIPMLVKKDCPPDADIFVIYFLNLFSTVISYFMFSYKQSVLIAHQRNDIVSKVRIFTNTLMYASQLFIVIVMKNYYLYLVASIVQQVLSNVIVAYFSTKKYPQYQPKGEINPIMVEKINGRIKDLFLTKVGTVIVSSADTIVITAFLGLEANGIYNNYYYVLTAVMSLIKVVFDSCMSGIGHSIVTETKKKNYRDFNKLTFIVTWLAGCCAVCLLCLYQPFMRIWTGEDKMLGYNVVICLVVYFMVDQINQLFITYKDAAGIWHSDRFRPITTALVNLALNVILVQFIGIYGVILSTIFSVLFVGMPWIIHNLFSNLFNMKQVPKYLSRLLLYCAAIAVNGLVVYNITALIPDGGLFLLVIKAIVSFILANAIFVIFFCKTSMFREIMKLVERVLKL